MALPLLPAEHIRQVFNHYKPLAPTDPIKELYEYMEETWIAGRTWTPFDWSVYGVAIRTNNDLEGWHTRLNHRCNRANPQFYLLVDLLVKESRLVKLQAQLVYEQKLTRTQRKATKRADSQLYNLWTQYEEGERSAGSLLEAASQLICPRV